MLMCFAQNTEKKINSIMEDSQQNIDFEFYFS